MQPKCEFGISLIRRSVQLALLVAVLVGFQTTAFPQTEQALAPGKNVIVIRGQREKLYFLPSTSKTALTHKILFAPGDGGWRGFAITIAKQLAAMGNDVYALDTKRYLSSFTGKTHLTEKDVMTDFHELADRITRQDGKTDEHVILVGWSTGAGLTVLAAADANKTNYDGLIAVSLGKTNILGWRWVDNFTYLTGKLPNEPTFQSDAYLPKIAPLPIFVIQSSGDQFIPNDEAHQLFVQTKKPKRFALIHANNHSFESNRDGFFAALQQGMQWVKAARSSSCRSNRIRALKDSDR